MRFAHLLRIRRPSLMSQRLLASSSAQRPLKRTLHAHALQPDGQSNSAPMWSDSNSTPEWRRPGKVPKLNTAKDPSSSAGKSTPSSSRGRPPSFPSKSSRATQSAKLAAAKAKAKARNAGPEPELPGPVHDAKHINDAYPRVSNAHEATPKNGLSNFLTVTQGVNPSYKGVQGYIGDKLYWRCEVAIPGTDIVGVGDASAKKDGETLAALSAMRQLGQSGMNPFSFLIIQLDQIAQLKAKLQVQKPDSPSSVVLSDGSSVDFERARQFMDYYCRRFKFGNPDVVFNPQSAKRGATSWEAVMTVGDRRIGLGEGHTKKIAQIACYLDVVHYLESCDPALWKTFVDAAKTGKDLGLAPKVYFQVSETLEDDIRDLCTHIRNSQLYKARPRLSATSTEVLAPAGTDMASTQLLGRTAFTSDASLQKKSYHLLQQRQKYLENPDMAKMGETRASLPVTTRASDLLEFVRDNDVTICMAATGSGKTTQIPQLILDEWIDKGEGAKCNIVCTQPRRIAAISVAERVAAERGQTIGGFGSVGYQVRFESKLPQDHGSITFCTTGVFLRKMQSALLGDGPARDRNALDKVTHIVVDEVHERDVDTDLLLVVLKRLMADRKARQIPLKIVLMSATIDPTLFQTYFPDDHGNPAKTLEIPGRAFPVEKHFMDDFVPQLMQDMRGPTGWVFRHDTVINYVNREMPDWVRANPLPPSRKKDRDEDNPELPIPLIALTVAHVLQKTDSGHVLVFLPGWDEIVAVQRCLEGQLGPLGLNFTNTKKYNLHLLHSTIPIKDQQAIFDPPPEGVRRIILATNIAETSVTIPDVVYVVDTGKIKEQRYDPERHMSSLVSAWVGTSNLNQRAGRAGRHRSGEYFGFLGKSRLAGLHTHQMVEMKRVDLSNVVMHVKALAFPGMEVEEVLAATIEPPATERVTAAIKDLKMVGALDEQQSLTALGRVLLQLPVDVQMGRLVLFGAFFRCLDQALSLAAILSNRDPFMAPVLLKEKAAAVKASWAPADIKSDALTTLRAYNAWWALHGAGKYVQANSFCNENFLSKPTLLMIQKIKGHIYSALQRAGVIDVCLGSLPESLRTSQANTEWIHPQLNTNGNSLPLLSALIAIGSQPKFAIRIRETILRTAQDKTVFIHPSSVNHRKHNKDPEQQEYLGEKQLYAFAEKRQNVSVAGGGSPQTYLITTTRLDPMSYMLFGAYRIEVVERGLECDGWLPITGNIEALDDVQRLKILMESCMLRVFHGITLLRRRRSQPLAIKDDNEREDEDEDELLARDQPLSSSELKELGFLSSDIVRILDRYCQEHLTNMSRQSSRPATPIPSPLLGPMRAVHPLSHPGSAYNSRPATPSPLSNIHRSF